MAAHIRDYFNFNFNFIVLQILAISKDINGIIQ